MTRDFRFLLTVNSEKQTRPDVQCMLVLNTCMKSHQNQMRYIMLVERWRRFSIFSNGELWKANSSDVWMKLLEPQRPKWDGHAWATLYAPSISWRGQTNYMRTVFIRNKHNIMSIDKVFISYGNIVLTYSYHQERDSLEEGKHWGTFFASQLGPLSCEKYQCLTRNVNDCELSLTVRDESPTSKTIISKFHH